MYLKSIEVYGFKSFANRIVFEFKNGITGIVGPNGSGKSNVGDAVRWVLGEQSAKQLRGAKMEDVIFSGTELRKPHGSAYVAITLDNSDHSLPVDYEEVTVARRVYRSGESEYLMNGTVCRLKDVNNLFFDTGIGKEGYSIIGQGQVERILSGKPEERRELFDEAAGIVKYKKNKLATEKELLSERQNLERVNDILSELEKQVGPLKEQSETAKRYLILKEELKKYDVNVFILESERTGGLLKEYNDNLQTVHDDTARLQKEFEDTKEEYNRLDAELEACNQEIDAARTKIEEMKINSQRSEGDIKVLEQQIESAKQSDSHLSAQITRIETELAAQEKELETFHNKKSHVEAKLTDAQDSLSQSKKNCESISEHIDTLEAAIEKSKSDIITYMNEGASLKAKTGRYDSMLENINYRKIQLKQRYLQFKSDEQADRQQYDTFDAKLKELEQEINTLQKTVDSCDEALRKNQELTHENRTVITEKSNALSAARSKQEALRNITERYDGYGNSIRRVMDQKEKYPAIIGVVADIIEVQKEYEIAVETALGGSIQNIVTENEETAKEMIRYLKDNKYGRATFLPLTNLKNVQGFSRPEALQEKGVIGLASTLVDVKDKYRPVAESLLGRILVVDNIDNAMAVARKFRHSIRIVTASGELLNPGGSMTGGAYKNSSNLLGRKRELDEMAETVNTLKLVCIEAQKKDESLQEERQQLKGKKEEAQAKLQQLYLEKNTITVNIEQISKRLSDAAITFASVSKEEKELDAQIEELNSNKSQLNESNAQQREAIEACEAKIAAYEEQLAEEKAHLTSGNQKVSECMITYNSMKQQQEFIAENERRIKAEEDKLKSELSGYMESLEIYSDTVKRLTAEIEQLRGLMTNGASMIAEKQNELNKSMERRTSITASHKDFLNKREHLTEQLAGLEKAAFRLEAQIEKANEKIELLNQYMWEEYELTTQNIKELRDETYNDLDALKKSVTRVKAEIKDLGDVNVNAIEDYKSVSERYEFLKGQHDDIVTAENNLLGIIEELDCAMKTQFAEKFKEIQVQFDKVFKELFGGGKSSLELVDEEDLLETGIRIIAQPPGKKLQNMMQLSGGEKALTAIALLFAIQSLKPSPFCLLDEIEAALDDSNVNRFASYLNKLTSDTQFIVITHRKGTMEAADVLYGITMQEKGVSTLVSVNLIENELDD